jgi:hypothetical protein
VSRSERKPVPTTLVEKEEAAALRLQMPPVKRAGDFVHIAAGVERFDTPIGRTLTREFIRRDPSHTPKAAVRHLPIDDMTRSMVFGRFVGSQPTSPRAEAKKGRPTPKRKRKRHESQQ